VAGEQEFQKKIRQLGSLAGELDQMPEGGSNVATRELVQLLMDVHGTGLDRIMELVFESADGPALVDKFARDPIVGDLLLLYSLHPDNLETRVLEGLETASARVRKFDAQVDLISIRDGAIQVRLTTASHGCASTAENLKAIVEECIYNRAPDLSSLAVLAPDGEAPSGFVSVENLLKASSITSVTAIRGEGG